jgi:hypothetical protein
MLLLHIKENFGTSDEALYVSLDNIYFSEYKLGDLKNFTTYKKIQKAIKFDNSKILMKFEI